MKEALGDGGVAVHLREESGDKRSVLTSRGVRTTHIAQKLTRAKVEISCVELFFERTAVDLCDCRIRHGENNLFV